MINLSRKLLQYAEINPQRLYLEWVSAAEGTRFAEVVTDFTTKIKELGALGVGEGKPIEKIRFGLEAAKRACEGEKLRWILGKTTEFMREGNLHGEVFTQHEIRRLTEGVVAEELITHKILLSLEEKPLSVREVSEKLDLPSERVLRDIASLRRKGIVKLERIEGNTPLYLSDGE